MNAFLKICVGLAAIILLGVAALHVDGAPGSPASAQAKLQAKAEDALGVSASQWAIVHVDGQKAVLVGAAPNDAARDIVMSRVAAAEGGGGLLFGGVTIVDATNLTVTEPQPRIEPFIFIAEREGDLISFSGNVPDQETRDAIYNVAESLFPGADISGSLDLADGAPVSSESWLNAVTSSLRALSHLRSGVAQASDVNFAITGEAEDDTRADAARMLLDHLPEGLNGGAAITIRAPPASIEDLISQTEEEATEKSDDAPNSEPEPTTQITIRPCITQLEEALLNRRFGFSSAQAELDGASREQLSAAAKIFTQCPGTQLVITGHTDSSGNAARNRQLSNRRAEAVRAFLISAGAPANRITATGAGSSQPLVSNDTPEGRERNRRIEINITTDE